MDAKNCERDNSSRKVGPQLNMFPLASYPINALVKLLETSDRQQYFQISHNKINYLMTPGHITLLIHTTAYRDKLIVLEDSVVHFPMLLFFSKPTYTQAQMRNKCEERCKTFING